MEKPISYQNKERYPDPTAYHAVQNIVKSSTPKVGGVYRSTNGKDDCTVLILGVNGSVATILTLTSRNDYDQICVTEDLYTCVYMIGWRFTSLIYEPIMTLTETEMNHVRSELGSYLGIIPDSPVAPSEPEKPTMVTAYVPVTAHAEPATGNAEPTTGNAPSVQETVVKPVQETVVKPMQETVADPMRETMQEPMQETMTATKPDRFDSIVRKMSSTYRAKNHDYGDSYSNIRKKYPISILIRLSDKLSRLETLMTGEKAMVKGESIDDTLLDLATYSVMELVERGV